MFYTLIKKGFLTNQKCVRVTCLLIRLFGEGKLCEHWNLEQFFPRGIRSEGLTEKTSYDEISNVKFPVPVAGDRYAEAMVTLHTLHHSPFPIPLLTH